MNQSNNEEEREMKGHLFSDKQSKEAITQELEHIIQFELNCFLITNRIGYALHYNYAKENNEGKCHNDNKEYYCLNDFILKPYRLLCDLKENQTIVLLGKSKGGKTHVLKEIIKQYTINNHQMQELLIDYIFLIELLGGSIENSSRHIKIIQLFFDQQCNLLTGNILPFLLEKERVYLSSMSNFAIFHYIIYNISKDFKERYHIMGNRNDYKYLRRSIDDNEEEKEKERIIKEDKELLYFNKIMTGFGFESNEIEEIIRILIAILYLGNIEMSKDEKNKLIIDESSYNAFNTCANLLNTNKRKLEDLITIHLCFFENNSDNNNNDNSHTWLNSLTSNIYRKLFDNIIEKINNNLSTQFTLNLQNQTNYQITIVDISGFSINPDSTLSHTQLFFNYFNEYYQSILISKLSNCSHTPQINLSQATPLNNTYNDIINLYNSSIFPSFNNEFAHNQISLEHFISNLSKAISKSPKCILESMNEITIKHSLGKGRYDLGNIIISSNFTLFMNTFKGIELNDESLLKIIFNEDNLNGYNDINLHQQINLVKDLLIPEEDFFYLICCHKDMINDTKLRLRTIEMIELGQLYYEIIMTKEEFQRKYGQIFNVNGIDSDTDSYKEDCLRDLLMKDRNLMTMKMIEKCTKYFWYWSQDNVYLKEEMYDLLNKALITFNKDINGHNNNNNTDNNQKVIVASMTMKENNKKSIINEKESLLEQTEEELDKEINKITLSIEALKNDSSILSLAIIDKKEKKISEFHLNLHIQKKSLELKEQKIFQCENDIKMLQQELINQSKINEQIQSKTSFSKDQIIKLSKAIKHLKRDIDIIKSSKKLNQQSKELTYQSRLDIFSSFNSIILNKSKRLLQEKEMNEAYISQLNNQIESIDQSINQLIKDNITVKEMIKEAKANYESIDMNSLKIKQRQVMNVKQKEINYIKELSALQQLSEENDRLIDIKSKLIQCAIDINSIKQEQFILSIQKDHQLHEVLQQLMTKENNCYQR